MEQIDIILNNARNSISFYCINNCKAHCCKTGKLLLFSKDEVNAVIKTDFKKYIDNASITQNETKGFYFDLEKNEGCPNLDVKTSMCTIHKNKDKPKICSDFPLFKARGYIVSASICPAVQNKMFEKYFKELEELGYKIV